MPILKEGELDIVSHSPEQTYRLGVRLGSLLSAGDIVCLSGDMGAGKTVFAAGIGKGWGALEPLTSPTYNLVHQHSRERDDQPLYHLDCYRLGSEADAESIGLDDILSGRGAILVEWPEHFESVLPPQRLWVEMRLIDETRRNLNFEGSGDHYQQMVARLRELAFKV